MTDLHHLDASAALRLFLSRQLSPVELMRAVIERHSAVGERINAFTETMFEAAVDEARDAEKRYQQGVERPGLLGLPVATKEKHMIAGRRLSQGLSFRRDETSDLSHPIVERIRRAGGIVHARTTSPEFSCATVTHSPLWGVTRNPWNLSFSPGGSSGGSGAALAAGLAPLATASDIAGSTRVPAAFTGTVGYKAPYGRIPGVPPLSADPYRGDGPMARTVADTALLANVMAGRHPRDHASLWPAMTVPVDDESVAGRRIALCMRLGDYPVTEETEQNTRAVADALADAGAIVDEVTLPWSTREITDTIFTHFGYILGPAMGDDIAGHEDEVAAYTRQFMADARAAAERNRYVDGLEIETRLQLELAEAMGGHDALVCPTTCTALDADGDYLDGIDVAGTHLQHYWESHLTAPFNIANRCPVLAVPSGLSASGVPTGVQIVGHPYDDATVFRVGAAVERARPWGNRHPDIEPTR